MKKILIIHNNYKIKGGEDTNISEEVKLLEKEYTVDTLFFNNHERIDLFDFISFIFGRYFKSDKQIINKIKKF